MEAQQWITRSWSLAKKYLSFVCYPREFNSCFNGMAHCNGPCGHLDCWRMILLMVSTFARQHNCIVLDVWLLSPIKNWLNFRRILCTTKWINLKHSFTIFRSELMQWLLTAWFDAIKQKFTIPTMEHYTKGRNEEEELNSGNIPLIGIPEDHGWMLITGRTRSPSRSDKFKHENDTLILI